MIELVEEEEDLLFWRELGGGGGGTRELLSRVVEDSVKAVEGWWDCWGGWGRRGEVYHEEWLCCRREG